MYSYQVGYVTRKPDFVACEQQMCRPGCASMKSDSRRCYSLKAMYNITRSIDGLGLIRLFF